MKAIMIMYDSLNLRMLEPYGCDWVKTPNFQRLANKGVTFNNNYVGSLPCMPARRELHTGRLNFLHRGWGPLEPFDDSMPEILKKNKVYSHLVSDHQHYWEDGGCTYHSRYSSWEISRGQEGDTWKVYPESIKSVNDGKISMYGPDMHLHDKMNRQYIGRDEEKMPQTVTFNYGLEFIENNHESDDWFLQIETFDPHEPFFTQEEYKQVYEHEYNGKMTDWPPYYFVQEGEEDIEHMRLEYAALLTMCDKYLGKVLDKMDEYNLWEDTMLIVNTDHGYLIGEHGWWSKSVMPTYNEIANTPLFIYDPRTKIAGERRDALTQSIDLAPTVLDFFNIPIPKDMTGKSLLPVVEKNEKIRDYALFGYHEGHLNITDGRYVYMLAPDSSKSIYEYTLMPTHMRKMFEPAELQNIELQEPYKFTKGVKTMKIETKFIMANMENYGTRLYDLDTDPKQETLLNDTEKEAELTNEIIKLLQINDCPDEKYVRFNIPTTPTVTKERVEENRKKAVERVKPDILLDFQWHRGAANMYNAIMLHVPKENVEQVKQAFIGMCQQNEEKVVKEENVINLIQVVIPRASQEIMKYLLILNSRVD